MDFSFTEEQTILRKEIVRFAHLELNNLATVAAMQAWSLPSARIFYPALSQSGNLELQSRRIATCPDSAMGR